MRALLLAAGRGERMRPLSDTVPKPLLSVAGRRLIEWQILGFVRAGIKDLVINTAHLAGQIESALGDGHELGARIVYSREGTRAEHALETLGGIVQALPLLGPEPFVLASSDILTDFDYSQLADAAARIANGAFDAHLVLVDNPPYHAQGDMGISPPAGENSAPAIATRGMPRYTYANIGVLAPRLFAGLAPEKAKLFPWLYRAVEHGRVSAQLWRGRWCNLGTPEELGRADKIWR